MADPIHTLERYVRQKGLRMTKQRRLIAEILTSSEGHVNTDELYALVRKRDPSVGYATIYRTVKLLTEAGVATAAHFGQRSARFEAAAARGHHDHLICTGCGRIVEFEEPRIEQIQREVATTLGFELTHHTMELYGLCADCR